MHLTCSLFSCQVVSDSARPIGWQHTKLPCPSPYPGICPRSCPLCQWCHPTISSFVIPFSSYLQSFQHQGLFQWVGCWHQVAKVLKLQLQHQSFQWVFRVDVRLTGLISLLSKVLSGVFSSIWGQMLLFDFLFLKPSFSLMGCRCSWCCLLHFLTSIPTPSSSELTWEAVQFSLVAQSCPTLCHPMDCSTPGFPVHHQLLEFTQTCVHRVSDATQLSHPLPSLSPPALNLSQHQGVFKWVGSSHQVPKYWSFSFSFSPFNEYSGLISFMIDWLDLLEVQGTLKSSPTP